MSSIHLGFAILSVLNVVATIGWVATAIRLKDTRQFLAYWQEATHKAHSQRRDASERAYEAQQELTGWKRRYEERTADYDRCTLRLERISLIAQDLPEDE